MDHIWQVLLANLALIVVFTTFATHTYGWRLTWPDALRQLGLGALFGFGAIALMLLPVEFQPGVIVDLRSTFVALAGFFGGPISGVVTALIAIAYRTYLGGAGMFGGVFGICVVASVGIIGNHLLRNRTMHRRHVLIFAAYTGAASVTGFALLPEAIRFSAFQASAMPLLSLVILSTVVTGLALLQERERVESFRENATFRTIIESLPDALNVKDVRGRFIAANSATALLMGATDADDLVGRTDVDFYPPDAAKAFRAAEIEAMAETEPVAIEQQFRRADGTKVWLNTLKVPLRATSGAVIGLITHNRDISAQKQMQTELVTAQQRFANAMEQVADGLAMFDQNGRLTYCNQRYLDCFPKTADLRVPGAPFRLILQATLDRGEQLDIPPDQADAWIETVLTTLQTGAEQEVRRFDGRWFQVRTQPLKDGSAIILVADVTHRKQAEVELVAMADKLKVLASIDGLTGLLNRRTFDSFAEKEIARSIRARAPISALLIDIDRFKLFNDRYGHQAGDKCLVKVARTFTDTIKRPADLVARYGGEEFIVLLPETDSEGAMHIAASLRSAVRALDLEHESSEKRIVTISIGVASYPASEFADRSMQDLISQADRALYVAKDTGRDHVTLWSDEADRNQRRASA